MSSSPHRSGVNDLESLLGSKPPWIAAVTNLSPDSFSKGSVFDSAEDAVAYSRRLIASGAQILDIGGESTAPGRLPVSAEEEIRRIKSAVATLSKEAVVSVDTYKADTARTALQLGAKIINDVSGMRADPEMANVVREHDAFVVLMYSKEEAAKPHATNSPKEYSDLLKTICTFFDERISYALRSGIKRERIILDPGMGTFISPEASYSWELLRHFEKLKQRFQSFPLFIATSRKGFLGGKLEERDPLSQLTALAGWIKGADIVRTHNAAMAKSFLDTWNTMFPGIRS